jgi:putative phosphoesterase
VLSTPTQLEHLVGRRSARIGVLSDTHIPESQPALWPQVLDAFAGVDAILHGGDLHDVELLDVLDEVAPTLAARGNGEDGSGGRPVQPERPNLRDAWTIEVADVRIGLTHELPIPEFPPALVLADERARIFGDAALDVLVYGHTHVESIDVIDSILCLNPGSPTYPHNLEAQLGTIAFLHIDAGRAEASVWQLTEGGVEPFDWSRWRRR